MIREALTSVVTVEDGVTVSGVTVGLLTPSTPGAVGFVHVAHWANDPKGKPHSTEDHLFDADEARAIGRALLAAADKIAPEARQWGDPAPAAAELAAAHEAMFTSRLRAQLEEWTHGSATGHGPMEEGAS